MAGTTLRVSYDSNGKPFGFRPAGPSISADGRYVAFAAPVVFRETQQASQITKFYNSVVVRDTVAGTTVLASAPLGDSPLADSVSGAYGDGGGNLALSGNGRYVAFASSSPNLVAGGNNASVDYFVRDLTANTTALVSVDSNEKPASYANDAENGLGLGTGGVAISGDGRYVAFTSKAINLVPNDTNGQEDIFLRDTVAGITERISTDSQGNQTRFVGNSLRPAISADGRYVAFQSIASNLVAGDSNIDYDIFVKDRLTGITTRVSTDSSGAQGVQTRDFETGSVGAISPSISADGRYVAFQSRFSNLVAGDSNGYNDIFVKDLLTGQTRRISTDSNGNQANGSSYDAKISADGRYVAFASAASNLVNDDILGAPDIFLKDLQTGLTTRISVNSAGMQAMDGYLGTQSYSPSISADGRFVAFVSNAANLANDSFSTRTDQLFLRDTRADQPRPASPVTASGGSSGTSSNDTLVAGKGRQILTGGAGQDRFVFRRLDRRVDRITDFEIGQDKIVMTQLLDRITPKRYKGNPIQDGYVRFSRRGVNSLISLDRNGERGGGLQPLVLVEDISVKALRQSSNFLF